MLSFGSCRVFVFFFLKKINKFLIPSALVYKLFSISVAFATLWAFPDIYLHVHSFGITSFLFSKTKSQKRSVLHVWLLVFAFLSLDMEGTPQV